MSHFLQNSKALTLEVVMESCYCLSLFVRCVQNVIAFSTTLHLLVRRLVCTECDTHTCGIFALTAFRCLYVLFYLLHRVRYTYSRALTALVTYYLDGQGPWKDNAIELGIVGWALPLHLACKDFDGQGSCPNSNRRLHPL